MNGATWSFAAFSAWLRDRGEALRSAGAVVDIGSTELDRPSIGMRVEVGQRVGEVTVWSDGSAELLVADLVVGDFVFIRDGVDLAQDSDYQAVKEFFERLRAPKAPPEGNP